MMNSDETILVKRIGFGYQVLSGLCVFSGLLGTIIYFVLIANHKQVFYDSVYIKSTQTISWIFHNFGWVSLLQVIFSALIYWVSVRFVKFNLWAKRALELITVLFIIFIIWFDYVFISELVPLTKGLPIIFTQTIAFLGIGIWTIPFVKVILTLFKLESSLFKRDF
jgi:hypothetical protein